jgi:signal peptidase II
MSRYVLFALLAPLTLVLDQLTKHWARVELAFGQKVTVIEGFWYWQLSFNTGSAFGLFNKTSGSSFILSGIGVIASIAILVMLVRASDKQRWLVSALALVFAGALGNVMDRLRFQKVTDFVLWEVGSFSWPVFNVADVALVVGVAILFLDLGKDQKKPQK